LTLAAEVQRAAAQALGNQPGAVVALEPRTGEALAMYSSPSFSPSDLQGTNPTRGDLLAADPESPLTNRATQLRLAPGSTFKLITTAAALESGLASPDTEFEDVVEVALPGSTATIRNADGEPCSTGSLVTLADAFVRSCNTVFAMLGIQLGTEQLNDTAAAFGFDRGVDFELETVESVSPPETDAAAVAQAAIGQRSVQATPLQLAMVAAAVANDGQLMRPFVVSEVFDRSLHITAATQPIQLRRAVSPGTAAELQRLMEAAVSQGTGSRAAIAGAVVGGKTGTAEVPGENPHAWFAGYGFGAGKAIAVAVLIENGGAAGAAATGGNTAAPVARAVIESWIQP
jgi:peptidoglycan glycosyltransferase